MAVSCDKKVSGLLRKAYKGMKKDWIILLNVSAENYLHINLESLKLLLNELDYGGIMVDLNRPYGSILPLIEEHKVDTSDLHFIDAISKNVGAKLLDNGRVSYLDSPNSLTDISLEIEQKTPEIKSEKKFLFLDSLTTLSLYNSVATTAKFSHFLASKMRVLGLGGILISLEKKTHPELFETLAQVCDKIIDM
jgi:hypothetical protein